MLVEIVCGNVRPPSAVAPEAACLDALVMRAHERRPDERFATALEMLSALESAVTVASAARVAEIVREVLDHAEPARTAASEIVTREEHVALHTGIHDVIHGAKESFASARMSYSRDLRDFMRSPSGMVVAKGPACASSRSCSSSAWEGWPPSTSRASKRTERRAALR
jgi:hypothetical protein